MTDYKQNYSFHKLPKLRHKNQSSKLCTSITQTSFLDKAILTFLAPQTSSHSLWYKSVHIMYIKTCVRKQEGSRVKQFLKKDVKSKQKKEFKFFFYLHFLFCSGKCF